MDLEKFKEFRVAHTSGINNPYKVQGKKPFMWIFNVWVDMKKNRYYSGGYTSYTELKEAKDAAITLAEIAQKDAKNLERKNSTPMFSVKVLNKKDDPEEFL